MKRVVILGSTGSIGKSLLKIISKNLSLFKIDLLIVNKNYLELFKQAKKFNVKNVILTDKKIYNLHKKKFKDNKINIFNDYNNLKKILNKKVDYVMSSIVGLDCQNKKGLSFWFLFMVMVTLSPGIGFFGSAFPPNTESFTF